MAEHVEVGARRARYRGEWLGPASDEARAHAGTLTSALGEMEAFGLAPVLDDGAVAGNGAMRLPSGGWIASASARRAGDPAIVEIVRFDVATFTVAYRSDEQREPTSDVALHLAVLSSGAVATLHGHALETAADAERLALPISDGETPFGTLEDLAATEALLVRAPYPAHRAWIRRGHGFLVGAATMEQARALVRRLAGTR
jgi:hypothetical protein